MDEYGLAGLRVDLVQCMSGRYAGEQDTRRLLADSWADSRADSRPER